jgi:hypothetical protein
MERAFRGGIQTPPSGLPKTAPYTELTVPKTHKKTEPPVLPGWAELLKDAVDKPGLVAECYHAFHGYSAGNQMLAMWQCSLRGIQPGPIATYRQWKQLGRQVNTGEKAIYLCQPVTWTKKEDDFVDEDGTHTPVSTTRTMFKYEPHWFALSQTTGEEYDPPELPGFDLGNALVNLEIEPFAFNMVDGNCMGYATGRTFSVNPLSKHQMGTSIHEVAHIVLGHTEHEICIDKRQKTPARIMELEAECVSMIVLDQLGEKDHKEARGYIQHWYTENEIPEETARHIFTAANTILTAGRA